MDRRPFYEVKRPDAMLEVDLDTHKITYLGYCAPGTVDTSQPTWSILRSESFPKSNESGQVGERTSLENMWANGVDNYNLVFDLCETYEYQFRKF